MELKETATVCATLILACGAELLQRKSVKHRKRKVWVKDLLLQRDEKGAYNNILNELRLRDFESFRKYLRMNTATFEELVERLCPLITKQTTQLRKPISAEQRLAITIRF